MFSCTMCHIAFFAGRVGSMGGTKHQGGLSELGFRPHVVLAFRRISSCEPLKSLLRQA